MLTRFALQSTIRFKRLTSLYTCQRWRSILDRYSCPGSKWTYSAPRELALFSLVAKRLGGVDCDLPGTILRQISFTSQAPASLAGRTSTRSPSLSTKSPPHHVVFYIVECACRKFFSIFPSIVRFLCESALLPICPSTSILQTEVFKMAGVSSFPEFGDFDDGNIYEKCHASAVRGDTRNFVIEFNSTKAYAAYDIRATSIKKLLQLEVIILLITLRRPRRMRRLYVVVQRLKANLYQKSASKAFKCEMDVCRPFCLSLFNPY